MPRDGLVAVPERVKWCVPSRRIHEACLRVLGEVLDVALPEIGEGLGDQEGRGVLGENEGGEHAERGDGDAGPLHSVCFLAVRGFACLPRRRFFS